MGLFSRLQKKPLETRTRIVFLSTFFITSIVALIWLVSLPERFDDGEAVVNEEAAETISTFGSLFSGAKEAVTDAFDSVRTSEQDDEGAGSELSETNESTDQDIVFAPIVSSTTPDTARSDDAPEDRVVLIATSSSEAEEHE